MKVKWWVGLILFVVGYVAAKLDVLNAAYSTIRDISFEQKKSLLIIFSAITTFYVLCIFMPLEKIAERERVNSANYPYITSAREHLRRRGSF